MTTFKVLGREYSAEDRGHYIIVKYVLRGKETSNRFDKTAEGVQYSRRTHFVSKNLTDKQVVEVSKKLVNLMEDGTISNPNNQKEDTVQEEIRSFLNASPSEAVKEALTEVIEVLEKSPESFEDFTSYGIQINTNEREAQKKNIEEIQANGWESFGLETAQKKMVEAGMLQMAYGFALNAYRENEKIKAIGSKAVASVEDVAVEVTKAVKEEATPVSPSDLKVSKFTYKPNTVRDVLGDTDRPLEKYLIEHTVFLAPNLFRQVENNLHASYEFLKGRGGMDSTVTDEMLRGTAGLSFLNLTKEQRDLWRSGAYRKCVEVVCTESDYSLVIDPSGYSYARYTAVVFK